MSAKCPTKRPHYRTRLAAMKALGKVARKPLSPERLKADECESCSGWVIRAIL